ncbi:hypothetical protein QJ850_gp878 [Acanthamoeba polyphaga mimivirus]|uniref:Uncharacterized protein n=1 Tax=Acanthamoeba polyphaga mimivirus Kroon TaxID=3069720 RepID=A0A0G2Y9L6_9VIRU|nr:hypothetical protein QJ850_gp878 [Acanthamoeba polyphaga mimivirus]AKI79821.1 hypothetical protein [Acanthamoeba polyphaga mimivirus Kroon]
MSSIETTIKPVIFSDITIDIEEDKIILLLESKLIGTLHRTSKMTFWESECSITKNLYKKLNNWMKCYDCGNNFYVPMNCGRHDFIPELNCRDFVLNKYTLTIRWTNYCSLESAITKTKQIFMNLNKIETNTV